MRKNIENLINSDISSYRISKETGIPYTTVNELRNGTRSIDKANFLTIETLSNYWEELNMTLEERILKALAEMDEEIRGSLYDVYEESNGNLWFVDSGMAYDGDDKEAKEVAQVEDGEIINIY